jgi:hypothetical protein
VNMVSWVRKSGMHQSLGVSHSMWE